MLMHCKQLERVVRQAAILWMEPLDALLELPESIVVVGQMHELSELQESIVCLEMLHEFSELLASTAQQDLALVVNEL
jgi:hypothetical protein